MLAGDVWISMVDHDLPEIEEPDLLPTDVKDVAELKLWEDLAQNTQQARVAS